jgi:hypothetical protein
VLNVILRFGGTFRLHLQGERINQPRNQYETDSRQRRAQWYNAEERIHNYRSEKLKSIPFIFDGNHNSSLANKEMLKLNVMAVSKQITPPQN